MFNRENLMLKTRIEQLIEQQHERLFELDRRINWSEYKRYLHEDVKLMEMIEERAQRASSLYSFVEIRSEAVELRAVWLKGFSPVVQLIDKMFKALEKLKSYTLQSSHVPYTQEHWEELLDLDRAMQRLEIELNIDPSASSDKKI